MDGVRYRAAYASAAYPMMNMTMVTNVHRHG